MVLGDAGVVVSSLVSDDQLLGKDSCVTLIGKTTQGYPSAVIDMECPFLMVLLKHCAWKIHCTIL